MMIKKILTVLAVLSFSIGSAQATLLTFNGIHQAANDIEFYSFTNLSAGDVDIWADTLTDGMDADLNIWKKVPGSTVSGQPDNSDWSLVEWSPAALRDNAPGVGQNNFGVDLRNGYVQGSPVPTGTSDPGSTLVNLAVGTYLLSMSGANNEANAGLGELMSLGFVGFEHFSTINTFPHDYQIFVNGDVTNVSNVPVPAAVWLFGTAIAGLGVVRRKKTIDSLAV